VEAHQLLPQEPRPADGNTSVNHGPAIQIGTTGWQTGDLICTVATTVASRSAPRTCATATGSPSSAPGSMAACSSKMSPEAAASHSPASYVAQHAQYGWASTIDGAQGATPASAYFSSASESTVNTSTSA
jgi:hypothetical protein